MQLYKHQKDIVEVVHKNITKGVKRQLITLATGGGKTVVATDLVNTFSTSNKFTLFIVHRTSLIQQTIDKLAAIDLRVSGCSGNHKPDLLSQCVVTTWQTLKFKGEARKGLIEECRDGKWIFWFNSTRYKPIDVLILDEAHLTTYIEKLQDLIPKHRQFNRWTEEWMNPKKEYWKYEEIDLSDDSIITIGLTATPWRLNPRQFLSDYFDEQILGATVHELQLKKRLSPAQYKTIKPPTPLEALHIRAGDYIEKEMERAYCNPAALEKFVVAYPSFVTLAKV